MRLIWTAVFTSLVIGSIALSACTTREPKIIIETAGITETPTTTVVDTVEMTGYFCHLMIPVGFVAGGIVDAAYV